MKPGKPLRRRKPLRARKNGVGIPERELRDDGGMYVEELRRETKRYEPDLRALAPKRRAVSPASREQRAKVKDGIWCRHCGGGGYRRLTPAHVVDRSIGGCDDPLCVVPLCLTCHALYDGGKLDLLPVLRLDEQAHAVSHLGILRALKRITNEEWGPRYRTPELGVEVRY